MNSERLAVIPARAGSKRFPGKNTARLGEKPLILYTVEAVMSSNSFDRIIVSTDDSIVVNIVKSVSGIEIHHRPPHLSTNTVTTIKVLIHILKENCITNGICGIFLPTCPLRTGEHISEAMEQLTKDVDSVVGVAYYAVPPSFSAELIMGSNPPILKFPHNSPLLQGRTRVQLQPTMVYPNGAIYLAWTDRLLVNKSFFKGRVSGYLMDRISSVDIDEEIDLKFAEAVLRVRR